MSKNSKTAHSKLLPQSAWRRRLFILSLGLASLAGLYTLAGLFLAPYLIARYIPKYAAEQLGAQVRLDRLRINPWLFTCEAEGLSLQLADNQPLFSTKRIFIDFELENLLSRAWTFTELTVENPALHLLINADGRLNLSELLNRLPKAKASPAAEKNAPPLLLKRFKLSGGTAQITDHSRAVPASLTIAPITLELHNLSTLPDHRGTFAAIAKVPKGGDLGWHGEMSLQPLLATGALEIKGLRPAAFWGLIQDRLNLAVPTGVAQLKANCLFTSVNGAPSLALNALDLSLHDLSLSERGTTQPFLKLKSLAVSGGQLDFAKRQIALPSILLKDVQVEALVDKAGVGNWQRLLIPKTRPDPDETSPWQIAVESLAVNQLGLRYHDASKNAPLKLEAALDMTLTGGGLDLGLQEASLKRLALANGKITFTRSPESADKAKEIEEKAIQTKTEPAPKKPWKLALDNFSVSGFQLGFIDQKNNPTLAYDLTDLQAEVKDLASPAKQLVSFALQTGSKQGGSARLNGTISQSGRQIEALIALDQVNLKPLEFLIAKHTTLTLASGNFSAEARVRYLANDPKPSLTVTGEAKIGRLLLNEEETGERLFALKELAAHGLNFSLNPNQLAIREITLREPEAKIIIFKDKSLNLAKIRRQESRPGPDKARPPSSPVIKEADTPTFPVAVERVRMENGVVDFADFSLVLPFATRIEQSKGTATGISTEPGSRTSLKFEGRVGEFGQAKAEGSLVSANPKKFTDIRVAFHNVTMPPMSPYTATFAGRRIAAGKLNLDLDYRIKDSELLGTNSVVLKDFSLGERVESPRAMDLPLDLAIALLTDSEGKIDIAMPISGNIDHPKFAYGQLIRQAIANLLSKIVTAPFRALAALFNRKSENLETILFEPGRAELAPPEQEKLQELAEALDKRQQLKLIVHGGFDPGLDGEALKSAQIRRLLAQKLEVKLATDEDPGPITYDNAKTQRALETLAADKLAAFQTGYEERTGKKVKLVNPAMALLGRASEDHDFYRQLLEYLAQTTPLSQDALQTLAEQRGKAIVDELATRIKTDATRITTGAAIQNEGQDKAVPARLELAPR